MRDFTEIMMVLRQMMGIDGWVAAAFLVGMFAAVIFRRDQIVSSINSGWPPSSLHSPWCCQSSSGRSCNFGTVPVDQRRHSRSDASTGDLKMLVRVAAMAVGPVLFGLPWSGIGSMLPRESRHPAPPERPKQPHLLD